MPKNKDVDVTKPIIPQRLGKRMIGKASKHTPEMVRAIKGAKKVRKKSPEGPSTQRRTK